MNEASYGKDDAATTAADALADVLAQTEEARAELTRLQEHVRNTRTQLDSQHQAPLLAEVNEQLVLAALRVQADADACAQALGEVSRTAELDALTDLPNRVLLLDRFAHAIANAKRRGSRVALLFLDLNRFKEINDTLGHAVGDEVLKVVALRLTSSVREADTVSRHGGDEFLVLIAEVSRASDAMQVAEKIIEALGSPSRVFDHVFRLTASIGISIYPDDGEDADTLINQADAAMYRAKKYGLGACVFHEPEPAGQHIPRPRPLPALGQPFTRYEDALIEHERRLTQLQEANEQLVLSAIGADELRTAAELATRRQTEFLASVVHELRSPLAPISAAASLMGGANAAELPRMQAVIQRQVAHMSRLVNDLLDVSRVKTGKLRVERQLVDLNAILDAAVDACRPAMDTRLQHLRIHAPSLSLEIMGDPTRLAQIVINLLDNASKYTQNGGEIALSVALSDQFVVLTVSDNGIGITAASLPHVFDAFMQDGHAIGFNGSGLGIGLTVVRQLVEAHGGTIVAHSAGSHLGSQFVVTLPWEVNAQSGIDSAGAPQSDMHA